MKTLIKALLATLALGATTLFIQAQPALKIATVDLGKALAAYYKTQDEQAKLQAYEQSANKDAEKLLNEGNAMVTQLQGLRESLDSPAVSDAAKKTTEADAQRLYQEIQKKEQELNEFRQQALGFIQQGVASTRQQLITEISGIATDIARKKGITMLVERNAFAYGDAAYDITDELIAELNKNKPVTSGATGTDAASVPSVGLPK
ncbi:MAG: OmpH family outer membrane protein [Opitutaceae bacterium]|jgi:outer membrane protein|nr:OmpH family outer membrane protein [Opitutaceae bacterium]